MEDWPGDIKGERMDGEMRVCDEGGGEASDGDLDRSRKTHLKRIADPRGPARFGEQLDRCTLNYSTISRRPWSRELNAKCPNSQKESTGKLWLMPRHRQGISDLQGTARKTAIDTHE